LRHSLIAGLSVFKAKAIAANGLRITCGEPRSGEAVRWMRMLASPFLVCKITPPEKIDQVAGTQQLLAFLASAESAQSI
jgi:hypothetical protein